MEKKSAGKKPKTLGLGFAIGLVVVGGLFLFQGIRSVSDNKISLITPRRVIVVERAQTPEARSIGLSNRESLDGIHGMLFYFDESTTENCFWMKDTLLDLDMVFLNEDKKIVTIHSDVSPSTYPETFCPDEPALYGLEVEAGKAAEYGIEDDGRLNW